LATTMALRLSPGTGLKATSGSSARSGLRPRFPSSSHEHIIRLLDGKLDAGQKSLVCAIGAILWPDGIKKLPAKVTLCRAVPEVINTENKLMLYTFTNIAKNFKKSKNISSDIMEYIFSYALLFSKEDIKYISYEDRSFQKLRPPL